MGKRGRPDARLLFAASIAILALGLVGLAVVGIRGGDLADSGDDLLPLVFAAAALTALGGWYLERRDTARRAAAAEEDRRRLEAELEEQERRERAHAEREAELERREEKLRSKVDDREERVDEERERSERLERAYRRQREWTRELRSQVVKLHREQGALGHSGDVREMVLQVALKLVEAEKGLLLSHEDRDGDGDFDLACHIGFDNDPEHSTVAQEFAGRVLEADETVREDRSAPLEGAHDADDEIRNLIAIPIYIQDRFSGVLICANREGGFEELDDDVLLALGDHAGAVLENGRLHGELRATYMATVRMLAEAIEVKDPSVRIHSDEVASYVAAVAARLEIEPRRRQELVIASLLHDVGKIGISERILLKPGPLTKEERSAIELHPRIGYRLVEQVPALGAIAPAVLHHHEHFDGGGYPEGLSGDEIPLEARVICVADSFSAMTSERPYRDPMELEDACAELERCAGTQFDPQVVELFVEEVRARPPVRDEPDGLAVALDDPEVRAGRAPDEPVLGFGPIGVTDNLTLLYSHRYMHEAAAAQAAQGRPFAVVLVELTDIEGTNAREGYAGGDAVIQEAAQSLQRTASRSGATACRHSGRRLALVAPDATAQEGEALAREIVLDLRGRGVDVTTGVAAWQDGETGREVVARARLALNVHEVAGVSPAPAGATVIPPPA